MRPQISRTQGCKIHQSSKTKLGYCCNVLSPSHTS